MAFLISFFLIAIFYLIQVLLDWPLISAIGTRGSFEFLDSKQTIDGMICVKEPTGNYNFLKIEECGWNYGTFLVKIFPLPLIKWISSTALGFSLILVFSAVMAFVISTINSKSSGFDRVMSYLIIFSPPNFFLLERGNIDVIILALLTLSCILLANGQSISASCLVALGSLLKFYPIALFLLVIKTQKRQIAKAILVILTFLLSIFIGFDIAKNELSFPNNLYGAFGFVVLCGSIRRIGFEPNVVLAIVFGVACLLLASLLVRRLKLNYEINLYGHNTYSNGSIYLRTIYHGFALVFLASYFAGSNIDYRLYLLQIPVLIWIHYYKGIELHKRILWLLLLVISWTSVVVGPFEIFGDLIMLLWVSIFIRDSLSLLKSN